MASAKSKKIQLNIRNCKGIDAATPPPVIQLCSSRFSLWILNGKLISEHLSNAILLAYLAAAVAMEQLATWNRKDNSASGEALAQGFPFHSRTFILQCSRNALNRKMFTDPVLHFLKEKQEHCNSAMSFKKEENEILRRISHSDVHLKSTGNKSEIWCTTSYLSQSNFFLDQS